MLSQRLDPADEYIALSRHGSSLRNCKVGYWYFRSGSVPTGPYHEGKLEMASDALARDH
jgi:hypothetical protein